VEKTGKYVTINFNTDGGDNIPSVTVSYDSSLQPMETVKEGFSFKGWFLDENSPFDFEKPISKQITYQENITLYAKFSPKLYRVIYDGNGNTEGEVPVDDNLYAEGDTLKPAWNYKLRKGLYTFKGWLVTGASIDSFFSYSNEQNNIFFVDYYSIIVIDKSDVSFTAVWDISSIKN
jgi:uncharacterized repeat protein (TIGR02543 family)